MARVKPVTLASHVASCSPDSQTPRTQHSSPDTDMSGNQFAALEIEKDTGSSSSAPTQTCEILEMDGVVCAISRLRLHLCSRVCSLRHLISLAIPGQ